MSVKVAIRVRPFNEREKFLGCISCVDMKQNTTILYQNRQKNKKQHYFTFDYSLWSHDEFHVREDGYMYPATKKYVDQQKIYNIIGKEMLENAWQGYNCCLFAYGQTGAGKSYSMIGYGVNRGIIPMACEEIFQKIKKYQRKGQKQYEITLSMLEIYNQKVQDLFVPTSKRPQNGLKIRENKTLGVYVQGLTKHEVFSYADIEKRMDEGSKNRSLASTLMNEYSSRAHTIVLMEFVQKQWINKLKMNKKSSFINLVDLAGSERVAKTGISDNKDRLKQASNINKSLHTLGRVIQILAEQAAGKGKNAQVPYRDSSLTRILQSALGGNSKTIMICAISPANDNYEETLSTLRYADQTKKIKNKPIVNESAVDKIIRELRQENERLKRMLQAPEEPPSPMSSSRQLMTETEKKEMRSNVRASMRQVQKEIKKNLKSFAINTDEVDEEEDSLMMSEFVDLQEPSQLFSELSFDLGNKAQVYITNLNEDQLLNYKVRYSCEKDILITNKNNKKNAKGMENLAKIVLCGLGIEQNHAKITKNKDKYYIEALSQTSSQYTLLNGKPVYQRRELQHNDRIILGINTVFIFKNNLRKSQQKETKIDYEFVMNERQQEMENVSLISPTSLNLFLSSSLMKNNPIKDIYGHPPTQAYNNAKKLFQQENEKEILQKLSDIEKEFSTLVKENQQKLKQKEQFYRNKLNELKKQKEKQKEQKSTLQQKLMMKSIQSETLRTKNSQLQKLKQKLSKYNEEKNRRKKLRESMLLANDDQNGVIEQDIIGQFVDLQDPKNRKAYQIGIGPDGQATAFKQKKKDFGSKNNRASFKYEEVMIEECEDNEDIRNRQRKQSSDSLLLLDQDPMTKKNAKKSKEEQAYEELRLLKQKNAAMKNQINKKALLRAFQFRRLYNIKIKCQIENENICPQCLTADQSKPIDSSHPDNSFISKYLPSAPAQDAELQQYTYKGKEKKKVITKEQMLFLEQQIIELQNKLLEKQVKQQEKFDNDQLLLNCSMDRLQQEINARTSFRNRRQSDSYAQIQLNLTQDYPQALKPQLKIIINDFIQVLAETPQLSFYQQNPVKIKPTPKQLPKLTKFNLQAYQYAPKLIEEPLLQHSSLVIDIKIQQKRPRKDLHIEKVQQFYYESISSFEKQTKQYKQQGESLEEDLLNGINHQQNEVYEEQIIIRKKTQTKKQNIKQAEKQEDKVDEIELQKREDVICCEFGTNTDINDYEASQRQKITSFTAFLNEQLEQTRQNNTLLSHNLNDHLQNGKQYCQVGITADFVAESQPQKEERSAQIECQTVQVDVVTDINMQTYEEFRQNNQPPENQNEIVENYADQGQTNQHIQNNHSVVVDLVQTSMQTDDIFQEKSVEKQHNPNMQQKVEQVDQEQLLERYIEDQNIDSKIKKAQEEDVQVEKFLQKDLVDQSVNTSIIVEVAKAHSGVNTQRITTSDQKLNTSREYQPQKNDMGINTSNYQQQKQQAHNDDEVEKYLEEQQNQQEIENYLQRPSESTEQQNYGLQNSQKRIYMEYQNRIVEIAKISELIIQNKIKALAIRSHQIDHMIEKEQYEKEDQQLNVQSEEKSHISENPFNNIQKDATGEVAQIKINQPRLKKFDLINEAISIMVDSKVERNSQLPDQQQNQRKNSDEPRSKAEMVDEQVQANIEDSSMNKRNHSADHDRNDEDNNKSSSNQYQKSERRRQKSNTHYENKQKQLSNSQQIADKFNLSFSEIEKHEMSYQEMSVMGFDGLLKEQQLNQKIRLLQDKIKELESQQEIPLPSPSPSIPQPKQSQNLEEVKQEPEKEEAIPEIDDIDINASLLGFSKKQDTKNTSKYIPIKKTKKKKKKSQMTEQQKKEHEIEKEIQAKIIQCNNQNIINQRNLQIHKRKREAEELRKILVKKQKVELQKQLLVLIPMIRRFNLIAREMKRLIEAKISVEYRNFSHYEMIEVLKSYSANKRRSDTNSIQIKIVVLNCEEGRIYTWPADVFKNRFEIAQQTFEKYLENNEEALVHRGGSDERSEKAKDPFWDPVDYIPQGVGYLSMEVLLYNLSYEGYVSIVYKASIIAKIYISITPVKVKKHREEGGEASANDEEESQLDHIEIFNIRSLLEKDLYFTISIQSIKFMKSDERQKLDDSSQGINLTSLNSNILKYNISYELLENDYKLMTYTTHEVDFVADKQFKKIDYLRRHSFQNISQSTLAYMSDCPIKFTLNVMKDYNEEVLNASFNNDDYSQDNDQTDLDKSLTSVHSGDDKQSVRSRNQSLSDVINPNLKRTEPKSDFSKKPSVIYENTELINKLETEAKKEQQKRDKIKKLEESRSKNSKNQKNDKDKECNIY